MRHLFYLYRAIAVMPWNPLHGQRPAENVGGISHKGQRWRRIASPTGLKPDRHPAQMTALSNADDNVIWAG